MAKLLASGATYSAIIGTVRLLKVQNGAFKRKPRKVWGVSKRYDINDMVMIFLVEKVHLLVVLIWGDRIPQVFGGEV